ncbi:hypothetical protein [Clostridium sp.]|uniref:hypothetical protein n=1 Tax=Clostridium sp. TaxID=1506 RepID=UPI003463EAD7
MKPTRDMEKHIDFKKDNTKEVCLGIAFGSGIGIAVGAILNNVELGMVIGASLGVVVGGIIGFLK